MGRYRQLNDSFRHLRMTSCAYQVEQGVQHRTDIPSFDPDLSGSPANTCSTADIENFETPSHHTGEAVFASASIRTPRQQRLERSVAELKRLSNNAGGVAAMCVPRLNRHADCRRDAIV